MSSALSRPNASIEAAKGVVTIHRDFGDRTNRKHARLKYVIAERGVPWFREELEKRLGFKLEQPRAITLSPSRAIFTAGTGNLTAIIFSVSLWRMGASRTPERAA